MKYYFKQRILSWFDSYDIYDENNNVAFTVKGELSLGHQLRIFDRNQQEIGLLKEKVFTLLPQYFMYDANGNEIGFIKKKITFLKPEYILSNNDWVVRGDFWNWNYTVEDSTSERIMTAKKKLVTLSDQYTLDIPNEKNSLLCLMIVLAIDIQEEKRRSVVASSSSNN